MKKERVRDTVTQARIKRNVRKIRTMIHLLPPRSQEEIIMIDSNNQQQTPLGKNYNNENQEDNSELQKHTRPLDKQNIATK